MGGHIAPAIPLHPPEVTNRWTMVWAWDSYRLIQGVILFLPAWQS